MNDESIVSEMKGLQFIFQENQGDLYKVPHPYFGFTMRSKSEERAKVNNYGFLSEHNFPYKKKDDEFVVGVLGGSVADLFAIYVNSDKNSKFISSLEKKTGKKVVVLDLALGSGKQPQQFYIASYFLPMFDLIINIDGFNEIWHNIPVVYPQEYPAWSEFLFPLQEEYLQNYSKVIFLKDAYDTLDKVRKKIFFLRWSQTYELLTYVIYQRTMMKWGELSKGESASADKKNFRFTSETASVDEVVDYNSKTWSRYTLQLHHLLKAQKVPYLFYIQPNQHVPGSKPLSDLEKEKFLNPEWAETIEKGYVRLAEEHKGLVRQGVRVRDLRYLFKDHSETLYLDNCCHFSSKGNEIMESTIIPDLERVL